MTNLELSALLKKIAAAYLILNENRFKIIAYEKAADSIENLTQQVEALWKEGKLNEIDGVGKTIAQHLDELFTTGKVQHFETILALLPASIFPLLLVPGIGPKKAFKLVSELKLTNTESVVSDLARAAQNHLISPLEGFGEKSEADILVNIDTFLRGQIKENRILISEADRIAREVMNFLSGVEGIVKLDTLGSLRRRVSTIGDIDISVATTKPEKAIEKFLEYPHQKLIEHGPTGASLLLHSGRQVDLRVGELKSYGAMLQYFTGSKNHNIRLREHALARGYSLNEYGLTKVKPDSDSSKKGESEILQFPDEKKLYAFLGLEWVAPELREDRGEVVAATAKRDGLPDLLQQGDIRGDLHIHTSYDLHTSHDLGTDPIEAYLDRAVELGYEYIGISDHNPSIGNQSATEICAIMEKRYAWYTAAHNKWKQRQKTAKKPGPELFVMCEVDILTDGALALPREAFEFVDAVVVSIHSSFSQPPDVLRNRVMKALTAHSKVRIFGHPTGRLLGKREGVSMPWKDVYTLCKERGIALEINSSPERLDVSDSVVFEARQRGVRFCVDTDSHSVEHLDLSPYGVSVARRGWATKDDVVNTMRYTEFRKWLVGNSNS